MPRPKSKQKTTAIGIRLEDALIEQIREIANNSNMKTNSLISQVLYEFVHKNNINVHKNKIDISNDNKDLEIKEVIVHKNKCFSTEGEIQEVNVHKNNNNKKDEYDYMNIQKTTMFKHNGKMTTIVLLAHKYKVTKDEIRRRLSEGELL